MASRTINTKYIFRLVSAFLKYHYPDDFFSLPPHPSYSNILEETNTKIPLDVLMLQGSFIFSSSRSRYLVRDPPLVLALRFLWIKRKGVGGNRISVRRAGRFRVLRVVCKTQVEKGGNESKRKALFDTRRWLTLEKWTRGNTWYGFEIWFGLFGWQFNKYMALQCQNKNSVFYSFACETFVGALGNKMRRRKNLYPNMTIT